MAPDKEGEMPDVFLSYASRDREAALEIQRALAARGIDVFWDQETPPGQDWDTWIRGKLTACKVAIVLWSRASIQSPNVRHEAIVARDANKLVPVMIEKLKPSDFPMGLYLVQAVELTDWRNASGKGMARLIAEIEVRTGTKAPGAAAAPPAPRTAKVNWVGVAIGILLVAGATALTQWIYSPKTPTSSGLTSLPCSNGLPRLNTGDCPSFDPNRVLTPAAECLDGSTPTDGVCANGNRPIPPAPVLGGGGGARADAASSLFSFKMQGRWRASSTQPCADALLIVAVQPNQIALHTGDDSQILEITSDNELGTRGRVVAATRAVSLDNLFQFMPGQPDGDTPSLIVVNDSNGSSETLSLCELT